jgi:predicted metal-dependent phosphoesterase TrpH
LFDLHLHTTASDGIYTPKEIVKMAENKGLKTIAITDHDTTDGISEALLAAQNLNINVIPGIEISTKFQKKNIDILGYNLQDSKELMEELVMRRQQREERTLDIIKKFCEIGINISSSDVYKYSSGKVIGRPHIARAVVEKGYAKNIQEVFDLYLADGGPCAVDKLIIPPNTCLELIRRAGGISVLAHPLLIQNDQIVEELLQQYPFDGLEVWHRAHSEKDILRYSRLAQKYNLLKTGGSDFHHEKHEIGEFGYTNSDYE